MAAQNSGPERKPKPRGKPFPKGTSGNPGGRPKEAKEVRELLLDGSAGAARTLIKKATGGNVYAAVKLLEFVIGKPPQALQVTGKDGGPLEVRDARERLAARLVAALESAAPVEPPGKPE